MTKFKCGFIVIVVLLLAVAVAIRKDATPSHCLQLLLSPLFSSPPLSLFPPTSCLSRSQQRVWNAFARHCGYVFYRLFFGVACLLQSNRWLSTSFLYIHYYSSLLFFFFFFYLPQRSCRAVLLFFSFLHILFLLFEGAAVMAIYRVYINFIIISLLWSLRFRCASRSVRPDQIEKQEIQQRKTRKTKNTSHRQDAFAHHMKYVVVRPLANIANFQYRFFFLSCLALFWLGDRNRNYQFLWPENLLGHILFNRLFFLIAVIVSFCFVNGESWTRDNDNRVDICRRCELNQCSAKLSTKVAMDCLGCNWNSFIECVNEDNWTIWSDSLFKINDRKKNVIEIIDADLHCSMWVWVRGDRYSLKSKIVKCTHSTHKSKQWQEVIISVNSPHAYCTNAHAHGAPTNQFQFHDQRRWNIFLFSALLVLSICSTLTRIRLKQFK